MIRAAALESEFARIGLLSLVLAAAIGMVLVPFLHAQDPGQTDGPPAEENPLLASIPWERGPAQSKVGSFAEVNVPEGYRYCGASDTQKLMTAMGNPISGKELGFLAPESLEWFVVFEFNDVGYVKDDEKDKLDAAAILKSIKDGTEASNAERRKHGWATLEVTGWHTPPTYNPETNNLEWCIRGVSSEQGTSVEVLNYNVRVLGRAGVMEAALVLGPDQLGGALPTFRELLKGYSYVEGQRYAEYRSGDKLAAIGLTALVTGGGVALAAKSGLLQKFGKFIVLAVIAVGAAIKSVFQKLFGGGKQAAEPQGETETQAP